MAYFRQIFLGLFEQLLLLAHSVLLQYIPVLLKTFGSVVVNHVENKSTGSKEKGQISVPQLSKIVLHMIRPHITQMHIIRPHITQKIN